MLVSVCLSALLLPQGAVEKELVSWQTKIPLTKVLDNDYDGRSRSGLEKKVQRLELDDEDRALCTVLKAYLRLVHLCKSLVEQNLTLMDGAELRSSLEILIEEKVVIPASFQRSLLERKCVQLVEQEDFKGVLHTMSPWVAEEPFDPLNPCLAGVEAERTKKIITHGEVVFEKMLVDLLNLGEPGAPRVLEFSKTALELYMEVDTLEMDLPTAKEFSDQIVAWQCLLALLDDPLDDQYQAWPSILGSVPVGSWGGLWLGLHVWEISKVHPHMTFFLGTHFNYGPPPEKGKTGLKDRKARDRSWKWAPNWRHLS